MKASRPAGPLKMAANSELEDEFRGVENDYLEFDARDMNDDDTGGSDIENSSDEDGDTDGDEFSVGTLASESDLATPGAEAEPTAAASTSGPSQATGHAAAGVAAQRTLRQ